MFELHIMDSYHYTLTEYLQQNIIVYMAVKEKRKTYARKAFVILEQMPSSTVSCFQQQQATYKH